MLGAALWGVLQAGGALHAPPRLDGVWRLDAPPGCVVNAPSLVLTQSGVFLDVAWAGGAAEHLRGRLSGTAFRLSGAAPGCGQGDATLAGEWTPAGMTATLSLPACARCTEAAVTAIREVTTP